MKTNVLIVGGGIIGSAIAWALAARRVSDVTVVDLDLTGLYASSELNAGGARATWWQPVNVETCATTLEFFREHAEAFSFRERGYLWLHGDPSVFAIAKKELKLQNDFGLGVELLTPSEVVERFPALDPDPSRLVGATFSPRDGLVNPNAVRQWYRYEDAQRMHELLSMGMVVDPSDLYFHPEGKDILAGYSIPEEAPGFDFNYDGEAFFVEHI